MLVQAFSDSNNIVAAARKDLIENEDMENE